MIEGTRDAGATTQERGTTDDPRTYDYSQPERSCDIVMKGGITSGVVYPHVICELARTYRFRNVGGTSAGAIAAAATAAAEYGRDRDGFRKLAELPEWIGHGSNLLSLFQPQRRTRPLFNVLIAAISKRRPAPLRVGLAAIWNFPLAALVGLALGVALIVVAALEGSGVLLWLAIVCGAVLALLGLAVALAVSLVRRLTVAVADNYFGICTGSSRPQAGRPDALTPWLADVIDRLAGAQDKPLTFGDLWRGPEGTPPPEPGDRWLNLEMVTTNLVNRRPERLPFQTDEFFFDPDEFAELFPERVVQALLDHQPPVPEQPAARRDWLLRCALMLPRRPLPAAEGLPVIVATRLSLSFPLLLSAIPLWTVDMSRTHNQGAFKAWREWARETADWEDVLRDPERRRQVAERLGVPTPEPCWFSDGGISSNFPIHFFDAPLPRWPTFAVNLRPFHPDHPRDDEDESENVWMPPTNAGGILEWWYRFPKKAGGFSLLDGRVAAFGSAVVRTMQNRVDEGQMRLPGYRDRVVHIGTAKDEGGMNLTMDPDDIRRLTARGRFAGARLVERFARPPREPAALSWANHRWVRYRSSMAALERLLRTIARGYRLPPEHADETPYAQLISRGPDDPPPSYRWERRAQADFAGEATRRLVELDGWAEDGGETFGEGAPSPPPEIRIVPRT
jgi:predicted acylesterase/phospholipase RssA